MRIEANIDDKVYIKFDELDKSVRRAVLKPFQFHIEKYKGDDEFINLVSFTEINGERYLTFPPNKSFIEKVMAEHSIEIDWTDTRYSGKMSSQTPDVNIKLRDFQKPVFEDMKKFDFDCILNLGTGSGKGVLSIYTGAYLKTTTLLATSRKTFIENYVRDLKKFVGDLDKNYCHIDSNWDGTVKPYMTVSTTALQNKETLTKLYDKVGLLILDEFHKSGTAEGAREAVFNLNPKYSLYMSATYEHRAEGFAEACLSDNIIKINDNIDFSIYLKPVVLTMDSQTVCDYRETNAFHERQDIVFNKKNELKAPLLETVQLLTYRDKRQGMVYNTNKKFQREFERTLDSKGISAAVINSDTKKTELKEILTKFEAGEIDVLISGGSLEEGVSLYKLSYIIDTSLSISKNSSIQLIGRMKRKDDAVCDHEKLYIKFFYDRMTDRYKAREFKAGLKEENYIEWLPKSEVKVYRLHEII